MRSYPTISPLKLVLVAAGALALAACGGPSHEDFCASKCDCEKGYNDRAYEDCYDKCVFEADRTLRAAENADCGAEFDDFVACLDEFAVCEGDDYKVRDACDREEKALFSKDGCNIDD